MSTETELLRDGHFPGAVHYNIKKYRQEDIPQDNDGAAAWLNRLWLQKEERLQRFYSARTDERRLVEDDEKIIRKVGN